MPNFASIHTAELLGGVAHHPPPPLIPIPIPITIPFTTPPVLLYLHLLLPLSYDRLLLRTTTTFLHFASTIHPHTGSHSLCAPPYLLTVFV